MLGDKEKTILALVKDHPHVTQKEMAEQLGWKVASIKYYTAKLKENQVLGRQGSSQKGQWKILVEDTIWQN